MPLVILYFMHIVSTLSRAQPGVALLLASAGFSLLQ